MKKITIAVSTITLLFPFVAMAFPFGGRASTVLQCVYNSTIYANLGPPRGGEFIWTTGTKTYQFGPPSHAGQWLLGLAGAPYYCIYRISPLTIYTGIAITMMGSSGSAAPSASPTRGPTLSHPPTSPATGSSGTTPSSGSASGRVLLSEVYYAVDTAHGAKPQNEWVEIYNGTSLAVNVGGWKVEDTLTSDVIPAGTIVPSGKFYVIAATSTTRALWSIPTDTFVSIGSSIGDGLGSGGDRVLLRNASGVVVDAVSWGTNATVFSPAAIVVPYGHALARTSLVNDTNSASDWIDRTTPTPGK